MRNDRLRAVSVGNRLFTVLLDFGHGVFAGDNRWLGIGVRSNGSTLGFTPLSPRQAVTLTPYAEGRPGQLPIQPRLPGSRRTANNRWQ